MSGPTVLSRFGIRIGVCGPEEPERNTRKGRSEQEKVLHQFSCSYPVFTTENGSISPTRRLPEGSFMNAWQAAMGTDNNTADRDGRIPSSGSISKKTFAVDDSESERQRQRSRSLQPQDSRTTAKRDNKTKKKKNHEDFVLPQYIGSYYAGKGQTDTSSNSASRKKQNGESDLDISGCKYHHIRWLPHGAFTTILAVMLAWAGFGLALISRQSLHFVSLTTHWHVSGIYEDIESLGVIHAGICYNETMSTIQDESKVGCFTVPLATNDDIDDPMFKVAAAFSSISIVLGLILTLSTTASVCWRTVNFRALGVAYILLYGSQSLTFLFFDTDICKYHECKIDIGCIYCIAASICWFCSCLICAKMELNRLKSDIAEERKTRKAAATKEALRKSLMDNRSSSSILSERTSSSLTEEAPQNVDEEIPEPQEYFSGSGIARQHNSIITLDPGRGYSAQTVISEVTKSSTTNTLNNPNRGRLEYQGKEISRRGKSRSNSRALARGRSKSRGRSMSKSRDRSRSEISSNNQQKNIRTAAADHNRNEHMRRNDRKAVVGPQVKSVRRSSKAIRNTSISPTAPYDHNRHWVEGDEFVTSYFDI